MNTVHVNYPIVNNIVKYMFLMLITDVEAYAKWSEIASWMVNRYTGMAHERTTVI